ncbi:hypothetical protein TETCHI1b_000092 [Candidatus Hodgkinia cicadicola]|nr:hypothetical protein TETCHI1b_000092 [Candidatus Hodgkinia cicadicola]
MLVALDRTADHSLLRSANLGFASKRMYFCAQVIVLALPQPALVALPD